MTIRQTKRKTKGNESSSRLICVSRTRLEVEKTPPRCSRGRRAVDVDAHIPVDVFMLKWCTEKPHKKVSVKQLRLPALLGVVQPTAMPLHTAYARPRSTLNTAAMQQRQKKSTLLVDACIRCIAGTACGELAQASSWPCVSFAQRRYRRVRRRQEPASRTRGQAAGCLQSPTKSGGIMRP